MGDFERDNEWQRQQRDQILAPQFYGKHAQGGRYVFVDKGRLALTLQKRFAVDTIFQGKSGAAVCVEEKIVRWPGYAYTAFCLETHSCTTPVHESDGWMRYAEADYLLYCFQTEAGGLDCYLIDFPELRRWFTPREESFPTFGPLNTLNRSMGRKVPIAPVREAVRTWRLALLPVSVAA